MHSYANALLRAAATAAVLAILAPLAALAQNPPGLGPLDHYKTYFLDSEPPVAVTVELLDQFGIGIFQITGPRFFSLPARKNQEPLHDDRIHLAWYDLHSPAAEPQRQVRVTNQFGSHGLDVLHSRFLLVPTLKNEPMLPEPFPELPVNHFKCYDAFGPFVPVTVTLQTQFGTEVVTLERPELLCNPAQKSYDGRVSPIVSETDHLVCYEIHPQLLLGAFINFQNQFRWRQGLVLQNRWLCVPSLKEEVPTGTEATTWSRVRATYR